MTSKEALDYIEKVMVAENGRLSLYEKLNIKTIAKDLEVLQVLKDKLPQITTLRVMEYEGTYVLYNSINCTSITKEEYELLKEWLENDSRRT